MNTASARSALPGMTLASLVMTPKVDTATFRPLRADEATLRDRFAGEALPLAYAQVTAVDGRFTGGWGAVTQIAYVIADHMLAERAR